MTAREFLVELCERQQQLFPDMRLFTEEDIAELKTWDSPVCRQIGYNIKELAVEFTQVTPQDEWYDGGFCPWCIEHGGGYLVTPRCNHCAYGKRHGLCNDFHSDYDLIIETATNNRFICQTPGFINNILPWIIESGYFEGGTI